MVDENDRAEDRGDDSKDTKSDHQRETSDDQIHRCLNAYYPHQLQTPSCEQFSYKFEMVWILKKKPEERVETSNRMYCIALGTAKLAFATLLDNLELTTPQQFIQLK